MYLPFFQPVHMKFTTASSFLFFVFKNPASRLYLWGIVTAAAVAWLFLKWTIPYATMTFDSYYYVRAAALNLPVNIWPIGYSRFIRLAGLVSHNPGFLLLLQYLLQVLVYSFFFFSLRFFFRLPTWTSVALGLFLFLNPLLIYTCNLVLPDSLFTTLSLLWLTQLLWIVFRPAWYMVVTHALLLLVVFTIRYNALYYPVVAIFAFLLCRQTLRFKATGIVLLCLLPALFIVYTSRQMKATTGVREFTLFSGWKLANNALYMYKHIAQQDNSPVPAAFRQQHQVIKNYFATHTDTVEVLIPDGTYGSYYMFNEESPLKKIMYHQYGPDNYLVSFKKMAAIAPLYKAYGYYLIKKYPLPFLQHFIWPNTQLYFAPLAEVYSFNASFYLDNEQLGPIANNWFNKQLPIVRISKKNDSETPLSRFPSISFFLHIFFIGCCLLFFTFKGYHQLNNLQTYGLLLILFFWLCDFLFSIFSSVVVLRYQLLVMITEFSLILYCVNCIFFPLKNSPDESR